MLNNLWSDSYVNWANWILYDSQISVFFWRSLHQSNIWVAGRRSLLSTTSSSYMYNPQAGSNKTLCLAHCVLCVCPRTINDNNTLIAQFFPNNTVQPSPPSLEPPSMYCTRSLACMSPSGSERVSNLVRNRNHTTKRFGCSTLPLDGWLWIFHYYYAVLHSQSATPIEYTIFTSRPFNALWQILISESYLKCSTLKCKFE